MGGWPGNRACVAGHTAPTANKPEQLQPARMLFTAGESPTHNSSRSHAAAHLHPAGGAACRGVQESLPVLSHERLGIMLQQGGELVSHPSAQEALGSGAGMQLGCCSTAGTAGQGGACQAAAAAAAVNAQPLHTCASACAPMATRLRKVCANAGNSTRASSGCRAE